MKTFTEPLEGLHEFALIRKDLESGQTPVRVSGCIDVQKSHLISALGEAYPRKLIITYSETKARQILADYRFLYQPHSVRRAGHGCDGDRQPDG